MRYPVPDEAQEKMLRANGIDPSRVCVVYQTEESLTYKHYQTGDEITIRPNAAKKCRRKMGW